MYACHIKGRTQIQNVENRVLQRTTGPVTGGWRNVYSDDLRKFHSSPNIRVINWRRMEWGGHVVRMGWHEKCI
jgi:hypothetical protein